MPACPKNPPLVDRAYRHDARNRQCRVIDSTTLERCPNMSVLAHVNIAGGFGMAMKSGDDSGIDLCTHHHDDFDDRRASTGINRAVWLWRNVYEGEEKKRYLRWDRQRVLKTRAHHMPTGG